MQTTQNFNVRTQREDLHGTGFQFSEQAKPALQTQQNFGRARIPMPSVSQMSPGSRKRHLQREMQLELAKQIEEKKERDRKKKEAEEALDRKRETAAQEHFQRVAQELEWERKTNVNGFQANPNVRLTYEKTSQEEDKSPDMLQTTIDTSPIISPDPISIQHEEEEL